MQFKVDSRKRIKIYSTTLWEIKRKNEIYNNESWFSEFVKMFADDSGLQKTSIRSTRERLGKYRTGNIKHTYYFRIVDKQKFFLAKIKYGI